MNDKHTPGPWTFHGDGMERMRNDGKTPARSFCIWAGDPETGKGLQNVAEALIPMHKGWKDETARANARLIAAAPKLAEALRKIEAYFTEELGAQFLDPEHPQNVARQALKLLE